MPRMIELFRASAVPSNLMQSAAKGALSVPAAEMIEILVYLARHNRVVGEKAQLTLAGWDEAACRAAAKDPKTPKEVLDYLVAPENLRPGVLPDLLENPAIAEAALIRIAGMKSSDILDRLLVSSRLKGSAALRAALKANPNLTEKQAAVLQEIGGIETGDTTEGHDPEAEAVVHAFVAEHAAELVAEGDKPYQPIGGIEELVGVAPPAVQPAPVTAVAAGTGSAAAAAPAKQAVKPTPAVPAKPIHVTDERRGSALQKIAKLDIKGRIQLAVKGTKEERSLLIRDGTKLVALAVLESPKITDGEVEKIASQKNVLEAVLRQIPIKRRFAKQYPIIRNLVANPRTPIDLSLTLIKNIQINDLKALSGNKEVSETIRKMALKMFKQKTEDANKR